MATQVTIIVEMADLTEGPCFGEQQIHGVISVRNPVSKMTIASNLTSQFICLINGDTRKHYYHS